MKSPIVLLRGLWSDFQRLEPGVKGLDRDLLTIENRFEYEGYGFLAVALPTLCKSLDKGLSEGRFTCPLGFKKVKGGSIPRLFSGMISEVFDPVTGLLKEAPNVGVIANLRQICLFFKKIQLPDSSNILLEKKAVTGFFQTDVTARDFIIPSREEHLLGLVAALLMPSLRSRDLACAEYRHGPGAVYEGLSSNQKWSELVDAIRTDSFDTDITGYADYGVILSDLSDRSIMSEVGNPFCLENRASRGSARLISVPKNSTSRRTITIEPTVKQFVQQGLNTVLRQEIEKCGILSNCLALTDQSKNQKLALEGSQYCNWATLDLKSASDLLSVKLVERIFGCHGQFFDHMMDCRSAFVEYGKDRIQLGKFAGMGNALTFPTQSVCFAVVCLAAIMDSEGSKPSYWKLKRASRCIRIYGDDIIVKTQYAAQVVDWLHNVGLKVNVDKSFLVGKFKESCGVDAFAGVDVTPTYIKHLPDHSSTEPSAIKSLVETSNHMWLKGYYTASTVLRNEVEERLGHSLPLVSRKSEALGWHSRQDAMNPTRWNRRLHRFDTHSCVLVSLKRKDRLEGYAALLKSFHVPLLGRAKDHLEKSLIRFKHRIKWKWVPTYVG